jgi:hypothetical protein
MNVSLKKKISCARHRKPQLASHKKLEFEDDEPRGCLHCLEECGFEIFLPEFCLRPTSCCSGKRTEDVDNNNDSSNNNENNNNEEEKNNNNSSTPNNNNNDNNSTVEKKLWADNKELRDQYEQKKQQRKKLGLRDLFLLDYNIDIMPEANQLTHERLAGKTLEELTKMNDVVTEMKEEAEKPRKDKKKDPLDELENEVYSKVSKAYDERMKVVHILHPNYDKGTLNINY